MPRARLLVALLASALTPLLGPACVSTDGLAGDTTAPPATDAATFSEGDAPPPIVVPPGCDLTRSPKDSAACIDDTVGIFVAPPPLGSTIGAGTRSNPIATIDAAITRAANTRRPRVYICEGTYAEPIRTLAAISVYGGFDCKWALTGAKPLVRPPVGPAIEVRSVAGVIAIEDVDALAGAPSSANGPSSIGALVVRSDVVFRRVVITAHNATAGPDVPPIPKSNHSGGARDSTPASGAVAGSTRTCVCGDATKSIGGGGASGSGSSIQSGSSVPSVVPFIANEGMSNANLCTAGRPGADGAAPAAIAPGGSPSNIADSGWSVGAASDGKNGDPGQGGGGGGAQTILNVAGGGGACGGCGGAGGRGGAPGGASIALVAFSSTIKVEASTLTAGNGANGGRAGAGEAGQVGGVGGNGSQCDGGSGGGGGGGGGGNGGAGGDSFAIAWKASLAPIVIASDLKVGAPGIGGLGGTGGTAVLRPGAEGRAGTSGRAEAIFAAP